MSTPSPLPPKPGDSKSPTPPVTLPQPSAGMPLPPKPTLKPGNAPGVVLPPSSAPANQPATTVIIPEKPASSPSSTAQLDKTADLQLPLPTKPVLPSKSLPTGNVAAKPPISAPAAPAPISTAPKPSAPVADTRPRSAPAPLMEDLEPKKDYLELGLAVILNLGAWGTFIYFYANLPHAAGA